MPPRFAYWTILIDNGPTAFRARLREELLPTLHQLRRTNGNVAMKWFARGRLWESPGEAQEAERRRKTKSARSRDWRPGGKHGKDGKDGKHRAPRARFRRKKG